MAGKVVNTLSDAVKYINVLYNTSSTPPNPGEEDYIIWTQLLNISISNWESEEGMNWRELFAKLADAPDGDKTTTTSNSYVLPVLFKFPNANFVWLGDGTQKTAYRVIRQEDINLYTNDAENWCYFQMDGSPTLEFNPNLGMVAGQTITYNYYKYASSVSAATDVFDMSDPMYAVYYALSELKSDEGDTRSIQMAMKRLEAMKTLNFETAEHQKDNTLSPIGNGFGTIGNYPITKS